MFALKRVPKWPYQENNGSVRPIPPSWNRKEVVWQQWTLSLFSLPLIDSIVSLHLRNIFLPAATGSRSISTLSSFPSPSFPPPPQFFKRTTYCWCLVKIANLRGAPIVTMHNQLLPVTKCEHLLLSSIWWFPPCLPKKVQNFQKNRTSTPWPWESRTYVVCFLFWKFSQAKSAPLGWWPKTCSHVAEGRIKTLITKRSSRLSGSRCSQECVAISLCVNTWVSSQQHCTSADWAIEVNRNS